MIRVNFDQLLERPGRLPTGSRCEAKAVESSKGAKITTIEGYRGALTLEVTPECRQSLGREGLNGVYAPALQLRRSRRLEATGSKRCKARAAANEV